MPEPSDMDLKIRVDTRGLEAAAKHVEDLSKKLGQELNGAFQTAVSSGNNLENTLRRIGLRIAEMALQHGLAPLQKLAGPNLGGLIGAIPSLLGFANGGVPGRVVPFADGGIVSSPTFFPTGRQLGVAGEAGAEAILPLRRGADGKLGVAAQGGGAGVNITFNVTARDAASFRKSEAQITGMLARAVSRGTRTL